MTFIDAVVAIAITLLVLPLIDIIGNSPHRDLGAVLIQHQTQFGAFMLTFVVIANAWWTHHRLLERVGTYDEAFLFTNLAWVLTVVLLPFSTEVIADFETKRLSVGIYVGTIALNSSLITVMALLVQRHPELQRRVGSGRGLSPLAPLVTTGLVLLALVLGVALPAVNFFALLLVLLARPLVWSIRHAQHRRGQLRQ